MKKSFKLIISLLLLNIFLAGSIFAEGYHVCVASYQKISNAEATVKKLENQSISAFINENKVKGKSYYRVLLGKEFKKIQDARKYRDEVRKYSFVKELGLKDFWVCKGDKNLAPKSEKEVRPPVKAQPKPAPKPQPKVEIKPAPVQEPKVEEIPEPPVKNVEVEKSPEPEPLPELAPEPETPAPLILKEEIPEEPKLLDKNEKAVLSEETPYSILVRSYKFSQFAENDCNRLKEAGFDAYQLNTFDENSFFAFNIHVGAFKSLEEAQVLKNQFAEAGIDDTEISDYKEIKAKIEKYDEIIASENVSFNDGRTDLPGVIPESVAKIVNNFPANKDYPIKEISILDYENYNLWSEKNDLDSPVLAKIPSEKIVKAGLYATCTDQLFKKSVSILLLTADSYDFAPYSGESLEKITLNGGNSSFEGEIYQDAGKLTCYAAAAGENLFAQISTMDLTKEEFVDFLNHSFTSSSLSLYPQMRRTLYLLPDQTSEDRKFILFNFKNVGNEYASERKNADWALPIVGHSLAETDFIEKNNLVWIEFYDLDYDFNAKNVHAKFTQAKNTASLSAENQSVTVNSVEGWYLANYQKEVSFSTASYVIAIDAKKEGSLEKADLVKLGTDLRIWNKNLPPVSDAK
ncbi:MAG: SPOR domain-containing protein [Treponema sp.]|nr:SPOR domain-containing protein [Treponema sp.]